MLIFIMPFSDPLSLKNKAKFVRIELKKSCADT